VQDFQTLEHLVTQLLYQSRLSHLHELSLTSSNPLTSSPASPPIKIFSQNDEDGIISRIFHKLNNNCSGTFLEFGVDKKMECNTLALLYAGWKGVWVDQSKHPIPDENPRLKILHKWVSLEAMSQIFDEVTSFLQSNNLDFLSIDLDGNDIYILDWLLQRVQPKVICVEYNGHYIPPARFSVEYNPDFKMTGDFYGSSLQSFVDKLSDTYTLVATNLTGVNAFFVKEEFAKYFPDSNKPVIDLYTPPRYYSSDFERIHPVASESLKNALGYQ